MDGSEDVAPDESPCRKGESIHEFRWRRERLVPAREDATAPVELDVDFQGFPSVRYRTGGQRERGERGSALGAWRCRSQIAKYVERVGT